MDRTRDEHLSGSPLPSHRHRWLIRPRAQVTLIHAHPSMPRTLKGNTTFEDFLEEITLLRNEFSVQYICESYAPSTQVLRSFFHPVRFTFAQFLPPHPVLHDNLAKSKPIFFFLFREKKYSKPTAVLRVSWALSRNHFINEWMVQFVKEFYSFRQLINKCFFLLLVYFSFSSYWAFH